jgi:Ca2+-binding RTX toxin-like protein
MVVWQADPAGDDEFEAYGQRVAPGGRLLDVSFRVSRIGDDGDLERAAFFPTVTARSGASQYLTAYAADGLDTDQEFEAFGRRLSAPRCGGKVATLTGTAKRDRIVGTARRDVIAGLGGNDVLRGTAGRDILCGGKGRDRLVGGRGADRLIGGRGADLLIGGPRDDRCIGGAGRDRKRSC